MKRNDARHNSADVAGTASSTSNSWSAGISTNRKTWSAIRREIEASIVALSYRSMGVRLRTIVSSIHDVPSTLYVDPTIAAEEWNIWYRENERTYKSDSSPAKTRCNLWYTAAARYKVDAVAASRSPAARKTPTRKRPDTISVARTENSSTVEPIAVEKLVAVALAAAKTKAYAEIRTADRLPGTVLSRNYRGTWTPCAEYTMYIMLDPRCRNPTATTSNKRASYANLEIASISAKLKMYNTSYSSRCRKIAGTTIW